MIPSEPPLVTLVKLVDTIPVPPPPVKRPRGRPQVYSDRLFLKALVIMLVRHLRRVHELLAVLAEPPAAMQTLRALLTAQGRYPTRRTWERRLKAMPATWPAQIGCLGRYLVALIQPWASYGCAVAIDCTILLANGGVCTRKTGTRASYRTRRLTPQPTGPNPAGTAGATVGNCTWSPRWPPSGFR